MKTSNCSLKLWPLPHIMFQFVQKMIPKLKSMKTEQTNWIGFLKWHTLNIINTLIMHRKNIIFLLKANINWSLLWLIKIGFSTEKLWHIAQSHDTEIRHRRGWLLQTDFNKIYDKYIKVIFLVTKYQLNQNHVFT